MPYIVALAGLALVAVGAWLIFPPAALILVGVALVRLALLLDARPPREEATE